MTRVSTYKKRTQGIIWYVGKLIEFILPRNSNSSLLPSESMMIDFKPSHTAKESSNFLESFDNLLSSEQGVPKRTHKMLSLSQSFPNRVEHNSPSFLKQFKAMLPISKTSNHLRGALMALTVLLFSAMTSFAAEVDLRLSQQVDNSMPQLGETVKYTVYLVNDGNTDASAVSVRNQLALGAITNVTTVAGVGSATYSTGTGIVDWTVPSLTAGDSVKLEIFGDVIARGVYFSVAEIFSSSDTDIDSSPNNSSLSEDDIATACYSVPLFLYPGDEYTVSIPAPYTYGTGITWFKDGVAVTGATVGAVVNGDNSLSISSIGDYTFTTTISTCPATGCCAIQVIPGPYGAIGDYVWVDSSKDGLQQTGEAPVNGMQVDLLDGSNNVIATTTTNSLGFYEFDSLLDGVYKVKFNLPTDTEFTIANNPANDALDSDAGTDSTSQLVTISIFDTDGNTRDSSDINRFNPTIDAGINTILDFDLALRKTLVSTGPFYPGQTITFNIDVINQGDLNATFVKIVDYVPTGLTLIPGDWVMDGDTARYTPNLSIAQNTTSSVAISFTIDAAVTGTLSNSAEIADAKGPSGENVTDIDSTPDDDNSNDGTSLDDEINQDGKNGGDEDDSDFAEVIVGDLAELGNYVWEDQNGNGTNDLGEPGVPGVIVELLDENGFAIAKDTTDANGLYLFENLLPGDYSVRFIPTSLPGGFKFTSIDDGTDDTDDSDANPTTGETIQTNLVAGESDLTWDAGIYRPASLGDFVWEDTNQDGIQDLGENGIPNVTVTLEKPNGSFVASTVTNGSGAYSFDDLIPGDYVVVFGKPSGYEPSPMNQLLNDATDSDADPNTGESSIITLASGEDNPTIDAGFYPTPVFDLALRKTSNQTSVVAGTSITYEITVFNQGNTDATAIEVYDYIPAGLSLNDPNWTASGDSAIYTTPIGLLEAGKDSTITITFDIAANAVGIIENSAEIASVKDGNGNDRTDIDSTPDGDPTNDGTPKDNEIDEDGKNGGDEDDSDIATITVTAQPVFDLALIKTLTTPGPIYPGMNVTFDIEVINQGTMDATAIEIVDYLPVGLTVSDANWTQVGTKATYNNPISVVAATTNTITLTATINANAIGGLTNMAEITDAKGPIGEVVSDIDSNYDDDPSNEGTINDDDVNGDGKNGGDDDDSDIADIPLTPLAEIGNYVWEDQNGDGINNTTEPGVPGVIVDLLDENGFVIAKDTTDANGLYLFEKLIPGDYSVRFIPTSIPGGYMFTSANEGVNDAIDSDANPTTGETVQTTLVSGESDLTWDAGIYRPASLGDYVWEDTNKDGIQDLGESGIANIPVRLEKPDGSFVASTTTDGTGFYSFENLAPGDYVVVFGQPSGYEASPANQSGDDALDSDADPTTGKTPVVTLASGENNPTIDAGFYLTPIYDLALTKASNQIAVVAGSSITYNITVFNQGNTAQTAIEVYDYIPSGLTLNDPNWTASGSTAMYNTPIGTLAAGTDSTISITFDIAANAIGSIQNGAEIASAKGPNGEDVIDIDSTPDGDPTNDGTPKDDEIDEDGKNGGDEDDSDIATITVTAQPVFDLALVKTLTTAAPIYPGMNVTFDIRIINQGTQNATAIEIVDYLPVGLTVADANWTQVGSVATYNNPISVVSGTTNTITMTAKIGNNVTGGLTNMAEITNAKGPIGEDVSDIDSNYDNDPTNEGTIDDDQVNGDGKNGGDDDDSDIADIPLSPLAAIGDYVWNDSNKDGDQDLDEVGISNVSVSLLQNGIVIATTTTNGTGFYSFTGLTPGNYQVLFGTPAGDFTATTQNAGTDDALDSDANPTTGLSQVVTLVAGEFNQTIDAGFWTETCESIISIIANNTEICVGDSTNLVAASSDGADINWYLTSSGGSVLTTTASGSNFLVFPTTSTIYYAALASASSTCPNPRVPVSLVVNARPSNPTCGNIIEVCGTETTNLNDHIINGISTPGGVFEWHTGFLPTSAIVVNPTTAGPGSYYLFEKSGAGCYSNPTLVEVISKSCEQIIDLSLLKIADRRNVEINDIITYTITVNNAGPAVATNVVVEDVLPLGLTFENSSSFTNIGGVLTSNIATIAVGETKTLTYQAKVTSIGQIINVAQVKAADQVDSDSTPGNSDTVNEDDDDDEVINVTSPDPVADLRLLKIVSDNTPKTGDLVNYTIRVTNDGPDKATNVEAIDNIPAGLEYQSSTGDNVSITGNIVTAIFDEINVNETVEFSILTKVTGTGSITNNAQITKSDQLDPDSTPSSGSGEDDDDEVTIVVTDPCNPSTPLIACANPYICLGESTIITAVNCNGTIVWSNGATGASISVSPSTSTIYTARCQVGTCLSNESNPVAVMVNTIAPPLVNANKLLVCSGESVTLTSTGCSGTIEWSTGQMGSSIIVTPIANTSYTAICKVAGCTSNSSSPVNVNVTNSTIAPTIATTNSNLCAGQSTTLTATGCAGTVKWSNGATGASISVNPTSNTSYTAICESGTCVSANSNALNINVSNGATPTINATATTICAGASTTLTANNCTSGVTWSTGATTNSITVSPTTNTTYTVTCGTGSCSGSASISIQVGAGSSPIITAANTSICQGESATVRVTNCTGAISWSNGATTAEINVSPVSTTTYTVTCDTGAGCAGTSQVTIAVTPRPAAPIVTCGKERICAGEELTFTGHDCDGIVTWSTGATGTSMVVNPTTTTVYSATCTVNGCVSESSVPVTITVLTQTPTITASKDNACSGESINLTAGSCNGTISWSTGSSDASITVNPTVSTTYTVTCVVEGCSASASKTINVGSGQQPTISASKLNICTSEQVTLTVTNCSEAVNWSTGDAGATLVVNPTETTSYTATCGSAACAGSAVVTITVGSASTPVISANTETICGSGSAILTASNCESGLTWSTGATSASITVSPTNTTTYTVTCGNGNCSAQASKEIQVTSGETPTITASSENVCPNEQVTLTAANCSSTVTWSTGDTGNSISVNPASTTTYTATCGSGNCSGSASKTINVGTGSGANPSITASKTQLCNTENVTLTANNCSGTPSWSTGATGASITVSVSNTTTYSVTCNNTCSNSNTASVEITVGKPSAPTISSNGTAVCAGSKVELTAAGCSGTVIWSNGLSGSTISVSPVVKTTYTAVCELQGSNCTSNASNSIAIEVTGAPEAPIITCSTTRICVGESVTLTAIGCEGTVTWSTGATGTSIEVSPTVTTVYTSQCSIGSCTSVLSAPATMNVGKPIPPVVSCQNTLICSGSSTVIEAAGCTGKVIWSDGQEGAVITVSPSEVTNYSAVCDAGICQSDVSNVVTVAIAGNGVQKPTVTALMNTCPNTTVDLTTAVTSSVKTQGGSFVFRTGNSPTSPEVSNSSAIATSGTFYVFESAGNGCFSPGAQIDVAIIACESPVDCSINPATASAGNDTTVCLSSDSFELNGTIGGAAQAGTWTTTGSGTFSNATSASTNYNFSFEDVVAGSVDLTLTTNDPDNGGSCVAATSTIKVTINAVKLKPSISSDKSPNICLGDSVVLTASDDAAGYKWSNGATTKSIKVKTPGDYTVKYVNESGCCSVSSDPFSVKINSSIVAPTVIDLAKNTCPATTVNLEDQVTSATTTANGSFEFHVGISPMSDLITNVSAVTEGDYYVFERTPTGCYSSPSQIKVAIDNCNVNDGDADIAIVITGNKTDVKIGDLVEYTITVTNNGPSTATNVKIENLLPRGITIEGATPNLIRVDDVLKATIPTLGKGETVTYKYTGKLTKAGLVSNEAKVASLDQTDPVASNDFSKFDVECDTCQDACIATALKADTLRQENGSWNIQFTSIIENCGNVDFTGVELSDDLSTMFISPATFTVIEKPSVNTGSSLVPNDGYNGSTVTSLLNDGTSTLAAGKIDTVRWTINLVPNGAKGPFSTNAVAKGFGLNAFNLLDEVTDISNDGLIIDKPSGEPTVVRLFKTPAIGLALAISDTTKLTDGSYDVTYKAIVKNNGALSLTDVVLNDTLSKTYATPASFSVKSIKAQNTATTLDINADFNGDSDTKLTLATSTMIAGQVDTICFVVNVKPATIKEFENNAIVQGTGVLEDATTQTVVDVSNTGYNPDAPGAKPTMLIISDDNTSSIQKSCIGIALYVADTVKQGNGSYDITYHALIRNCGNVNLKNIQLCDTLANTFNSPSVASVVGIPSLGAGSTLAINSDFNGVDKTCLLDSTLSSLAPNKVDTLKWTVNLTLNSFNGPFRNNVMVVGETANGDKVSDMSNNGTNPNPEGAAPTVLNFNNLPQALIGLAKEVEDVKSIGDGKYEVIFNFTVKNYGIKDFERVQVQDNLAATFGDKVMIDSTTVIETSDNFTANPIFTGKGQLIDMLVDSTSTLARNGAGFVKLWTRVDVSQADSAVFENMAMAIGYTTDSSIDDQSTEGNDPDPEADGTPENNSVPTRVDLGEIKDTVAFTPLGIAKSVSDTASIVDGSVQIEYMVIVRNYGTRELTNITLEDSLSAVFKDSTDFSILGTPTLSAGSNLRLNSNFDGITDYQLLADSSTLAVGVQDTISFKVKVRNNKALAQEYLNSIYGIALDSTTTVKDVSHSGVNPDGNGNSNPGDDNAPTAITIKGSAPVDTSAIGVSVLEGISPNGDGANDVFTITGITESDEVNVKIYNRWGHLVFISENYRKDFPAENQGWNGVVNSGILSGNAKGSVPDGTYFYSIHSKNTRIFEGKPKYDFLTVAGSSSSK